MKKKHLAVHLTIGWIFCEFVGIQKSCGFNNKILSACWRYKPGLYFTPCIRYKWGNSIEWSAKVSTLTRQGLI